MADVPQRVTDENRAGIDEWAMQSRMLLVTEDDTRLAAERTADAIAALGHPGAGRALFGAAYVVTQVVRFLYGATGQELDAEEALALLGMAGLVLADREAGHG